MAEIGLVTKVDGHILQLEIPRSKACSVCKACTPLDGKDTMTCFVLNECGAKVGDRVEIAEASQSRELFSAVYLYGIPLAVFVVLILLGSAFLKELTAFLLAMAGLAGSYLILYFKAKKMNNEAYMGRAIRKAEATASEPENRPESD